MVAHAPGQDSAVAVEGAGDSLQEYLARSVRDVLPVAFGAFALGCGLYSVFNFHDPETPGATVLAWLCAVIGLGLALFAARLYRHPASLHRAHLINGLSATMALGILATHFVLDPVPSRTTSFVILVLSVGGLVLSRPWRYGITAGIWVVWGIVAAQAPADPGWGQVGIMLGIATVFSGAVSYLRFAAMRTSWLDRQRLAQANRRLALTQASVDRAPDAIFWVGVEGRFIYVNHAACRSLGYERTELLGMSLDDIHREPFSPELRDDFALRMGRGERIVFEAEHLRKDGSSFPVEVSINAIGDGSAGVFACVARDLTERRAMQRDVDRAQRMDGLQVLAGGLAHDFNNMLTTVTGNAEFLVESSLGKGEDEAAREIQHAAERAVLLTGQLLTFAGRTTSEHEPLDVSEEISNVARLLESLLPKGVSLELHLDPALPAIRGDAAELQQVAMNLVTNAGEAMRGSGDVTLRTRLETLPALAASKLEPVTERPAGDYVVLDVIDSGVGISSEDRSRIFDPFFTRKAHGRGLGLAAVVGIVRRHGGGIRLESETGAGTSIRVYFPSSGDTLQSWRGAGPDAALVARGRVLVVDDEPAVRAIACRTMERLGFVVEAAGDGESALERLRDAGRPLDLVLLDMTMPGMSGAETFSELRALHPELPVVLNSGYDEGALSSAIADDTRALFLAKPYRREQLLSAVERVLSPQRV